MAYITSVLFYLIHRWG